MRQLFIDSDKRTSTSASTSDYAVDVQPTIKNENGRWKLMNSRLPTSLYNIESDNKVIDYKLNGGGAATATLTEGWYNSTELATELSTILSASTGVTILATYDSKTQFMTITSTPDTMEFLWSTGANAGSDNDLWRMVGFTSSNFLLPADTADTTVSTGIAVTRMYREDNAYMNISASGQILGDTTVLGVPSEFISFVIPLTAEHGTVNEYDSSMLDYRIDVPYAINQIKISINKRNGAPFNFKGAPCYFILQEV